MEPLEPPRSATALYASTFFKYISFFNFYTYFSSPRNRRVQGISNSPCTKSNEYLRFPITVHIISQPSWINTLHIQEIFLGKCPTVSPESFFPAIAYRSTTFLSSRSVYSSSPKHCSPHFFVYMVTTNTGFHA